MKYKERRGNVFVFDGGYGSGELELIESDSTCFMLYIARGRDRVYIDENLNIKHDPIDYLYYEDIQTAVNLMTILKDEGLV